MNKYSSLFSQLLSLFPRLEFERLVKQTGTEYAAKGFSSWGHFVAMLFSSWGKPILCGKSVTVWPVALGN